MIFLKVQNNRNCGNFVKIGKVDATSQEDINEKIYQFPLFISALYNDQIPLLIIFEITVLQFGKFNLFG